MLKQMGKPLSKNKAQMDMSGNKRTYESSQQQQQRQQQQQQQQQQQGPGGLIQQVHYHKVANINNMMAENLSPVRASDFQPLLPPAEEHLASRVCLVLDLDETLVHSSFKPVAVPDLIIPVEIKGNVHQVYVRKRPYVEEFMKRVAQMFEVVVFTASLAEYADPLLDELDEGGTLIHHRLFREHCSNTSGLFVKDLSLLGRPLQRVCIIDNSPTSFLFQPRNSVQCTSWFEDMSDTELYDLLPVMEDLAGCPSIYHVLDEFRMQMVSGTGLGNLQSYRPMFAVGAGPSTDEVQENNTNNSTNNTNNNTTAEGSASSAAN